MSKDLRHLDAAGDRHVEAPHGTPDADRRRPSTITLNCDLDGMEVGPEAMGRDLARKLSWVAGQGEPGR